MNPNPNTNTNNNNNNPRQANLTNTNPWAAHVRQPNMNSPYPGWPPNPSGDPRLNPYTGFRGAEPQVHPSTVKGAPEGQWYDKYVKSGPASPLPPGQSSRQTVPNRQGLVDAFADHKRDAVARAQSDLKEVEKNAYLYSATKEARSQAQSLGNTAESREFRKLEAERGKAVDESVKKLNESGKDVADANKAKIVAKHK
ncbi:hypothetical protein K474DRAFT_89123 [Panus rudis PR-1116 ss-1]|nr:hypothetical protein K474DRAFT_89123 [Panus rudis PR-1116 ss-1]